MIPASPLHERIVQARQRPRLPSRLHLGRQSQQNALSRQRGYDHTNRGVERLIIHRLPKILQRRPDILQTVRPSSIYFGYGCSFLSFHKEKLVPDRLVPGYDKLLRSLVGRAHHEHIVHNLTSRQLSTKQLPVMATRYAVSEALSKALSSALKIY